MPANAAQPVDQAARELVSAGSQAPAPELSAPVQTTPAFDAPTPLSTAAKASVTNGEIPTDLLPDMNRLFDETAPLTNERSFGTPTDIPMPATPVQAIPIAPETSIDSMSIPGATPLPTAPLSGLKIDDDAKVNVDEPNRLSPEVEARLFGHDDKSGSIVGPDRAPGSILFPVLLLVVIIAATMLAMKLTGLWI